MPEKPRKASDSIPASIKAIPMPCKGFGTSAYTSFSRRDAIRAIARAKPKPEPMANTMLFSRL